MKKIIKIYTDGACKGNPGPGGWGVLLTYDEHKKEIYGGAPHTTNNKMELTAVIEGLKAINRSATVEIITDSQYVKNGVEKWLKNWKANNWKTSTGEPVKNIDYWLALDEQIQRHVISWSWIKGHSGHTENEAADALANKGAMEFKSKK